MSVLNPTNYLELVQRFSIECGIAGNGPSTVVGADGQSRELCQYINQAWVEIQNLHDDWDFMLVSPGVSFVTVAAQTANTPTQAGVTDGEVSKWKRDTFRSYLTSAGTPSEIVMDWVPYDEWRDAYNIGALRTSQVNPTVFSVHPNQSLMVQCPLAGYTITGDYYQMPQVLDGDADTLSLPARYIMLPVYKAMMFYGAFESAPEVYGQGERLYNAMMNTLENARLPEIMTGGALV